MLEVTLSINLESRTLQGCFQCMVCGESIILSCLYYNNIIITYMHIFLVAYGVL